MSAGTYDHGEFCSDDYEDVYIAINFPDFNDTNFLDGKVLKISNITSSEPRCKIDDNEFAGRHELSLGSQLFFTDDGSENPELVTMAMKAISFKLSRVCKLKDAPNSKQQRKGKRNLLRKTPMDNSAEIVDICDTLHSDSSGD